MGCSLVVLHYNEKENIDKLVNLESKIINISKLLMYLTDNDDLKQVFIKQLTLIYTDTDSFLFCVETDDLNKKLIVSEIKKKLDASEYFLGHALYDAH